MEKIQKAWDSCFYCIFALIICPYFGGFGGNGEYKCGCIPLQDTG